MSFADFVREDQRLIILRILSKLPGYSSSHSIIFEGVTRYGHHPTRLEIKEDLRWLEDRGLVSIENNEAIVIARLTERGGEVLAGRMTVEGVKRPTEGD